MKQSRYKLTISMLVSGREDTTEKSLDSLAPLLHGIACELILVDTGCRAKFCKRLHKYTDKIVPFTWCNDFAAARNVGLMQAQGEWFLFLDDDEWFEDVTPILDFFRTGAYRRYHQANYKVRNYEDAGGHSYYERWVSRMIKVEPDTRFEGKVHEYLVPAKGDTAQLDAFVHHYGYVYVTEEQKKAHAARNIPLLKEMMREHPDDLRWPMHLLVEYYSTGDYDQLAASAWETLRAIEGKNDARTNLERGTFYTAVLMADQGKDAADALFSHFEEFIADRRNPNCVCCSLYKMAALGAQMSEKLDLAVEYARRYFVSYEAYGKEKKSEQDRLLDDTIIFVRDNTLGDMVNFMRAVWAVSLIFDGRTGEFPEEHRRAYQAFIDNKLAAGGYQVPQYVKLMEQEGLIRLQGKPGRAPANKGGAERPLLTISLLVSNRPDTVRRALDSLEPIREQLSSELILVDTSKSEEIHAVLLEYTDQVVTFDWCDDFAAARNAGLSQAHGEWFLYLDDDEWFADTAELVRFFQSGEYHRYDRASYIQRNFRDDRMVHYSDCWALRLTRLDADTRFEGRIHEYFVPACSRRKQLPVVANHTGYMYRTREDKLRHYERNSSLLLEMIKEEPDNLRWKTHLIQEYSGIQDGEKLYEFSRSSLESVTGADTGRQSSAIGCFYAGTVDGLLLLERYEEAEAFARRGEADSRITRLAKSYLLLDLGELYERTGEWEKSAQAVQQYLENAAYYESHQRDLQEERNEILLSETFELLSMKKAYSILCCDGLRRGDVSRLRTYYPRLEWDTNVMYVYNGFPAALFEAMGTMPAEDIFRTAWKDLWKSADLKSRFCAHVHALYKDNCGAFDHILELVASVDPDTAQQLRAKEEYRPVLSVSMLISNRPDTARRALESLQPILEQIPCELILVDTSGSQDIHALLAEYTDHVVEFAWCDDFSKARNAGLSQAKGEWFLYLDDDEWFSETEELTAFFKSGEYRSYQCANYIQRNYYDVQLSYYSDTWVSRMVRLDAQTHFEGKIHEYLVPAGGACRQLHAVAGHTGYIFADEEEQLRHFERNSTLLLDMIREQPDRLRWKVQLAQEYRSVKKWKELHDFCTACLEETRALNAPEDVQVIGTFYAGAVEALLGLGQNGQAAEAAESGRADARMGRLCHACLSLKLGIAAYRNGAFEASEQAVADYFKDEAYFKEHEDELERQKETPFVEEAFDEVERKKGYALLICNGLQRQDISALEEYYDRLEWDKRVIYVSDDILPALQKAMHTMPMADIFVRVWKDAWNNRELREQLKSDIADVRQTDADGCARLMQIVCAADLQEPETLYAAMYLAAKEKRMDLVLSCIGTRPREALEEMLPQAMGQMEPEQLKELENLCGKKPQGMLCEPGERENANEPGVPEGTLQGQLFVILLKYTLLEKAAGGASGEELAGRKRAFVPLATAFLETYYRPEVIANYEELLPEYGRTARQLARELAEDDSDLRTIASRRKQWNDAVEGTAPGTDLAESEVFFAALCEWNLRYGRSMYTEAAFAGGMEMLPDSCRAAVFLDRAMNCTADEWNQKLAYLGEAVRAWPALAEKVKRYARQLGEERERQQMKTQILQQIRLLSKNGMNAEALAVLEQLKGMLPKDGEIAAVEEELRVADAIDLNGV